METILQCGARADVRTSAAQGLLFSRVAGAGTAEGTEGAAAARGFHGTGGRSSDEGIRISQKVAKSAKGGVLDQNGMPARGGLTVLVPKFGRMERWDEWMWRELREGGRFQRYLDLEKRRSDARLRAVRRKMDGWQQNNRSDFRLVAAVPAREYFRWKGVDPHFWEDDGNLKSWRRDNPDAFVKV
jgi:hypothetical protein